jgi:signal transduction histidine kinase
MDNPPINFGIFALVGVIMLILAGASSGYLLQVKNKSMSSWMLLWFFLCVIPSSIATILTNTGTTWGRAFAPAQDAMLILGGLFLVRYAYAYPSEDQPGETRLVVTMYATLTLAVMGYAVFFAVQFLSNLPAQLDEYRAYYLITPLAMVFAVLIFFRRSMHWSAHRMNPGEKDVTPGKGVFTNLFRPGNMPALALRNFGLALAIGLIPVIVFLIKPVLPPLVASFLFNFGVVMAIGAVMLVYLNHAPEPTTISAKLVGISLVTVLLILGLASVWFVINTRLVQVHDTVLMFIYLVLLSSVCVIFLFPFFFRSTLLNPLNSLLKGVKAANNGNLEIQVGVQYEDEIGFLTHSFNQMLKSLNDATQALKNESSVLEELVAERTHLLTTFLDMAILSDQAQDLVDFLQPTLATITEIAACDACTIHILDEGKPNLRLIAQRGIPLDFRQSMQDVKMEAGFAGWLEDLGKHQVLDGGVYSPVFPDPFCIPGYHAFFAAPLSARGQVRGLLSCYRVADDPFSPFQVTLSTAIGELLGIIVENYRLRIEAEELATIEERQRLAREIHDAVSQSVYSLSLFARSAKDALDTNDQNKLLSNLQYLEATSIQAMREMRLLLYQLRAPGGDTDIHAAMEARFNQVERRLGLHATYEIEDNIVLPVHFQHEIWRIITEALNNTLKHSDAKQVQVRIFEADEHLMVTIQDDGIGLDDSQDTPGMGLRNMRTRAGALGGRLIISSKPAHGTKVELDIPHNNLVSG